MVAKGLLDTLRAVGDSEEQTTAVLTAMVKLSEDTGKYWVTLKKVKKCGQF